MPATYGDRLNGVQTSLAVKAPVRVATTANITLSGTQTIDGVAVVADDRVLVKDQTTASENGIYVVSATAWSRATDFDGARDVVYGTRVLAGAGTVNPMGEWMVTTANPITIGSSSIAFSATSQLVSTLGQNKKQTFTAGVGFTAGVSTTITITETPIPSSKDALRIFFDGVYEGEDDWEYNTSTGVVTFDAAIGGGVAVISTEWFAPIGIATPGDATVTPAKIAGITPAAMQLLYLLTSTSFGLATLTAAGLALLDDANAAAQRTTLGLGTAAVEAASAFDAAGSAAAAEAAAIAASQPLDAALTAFSGLTPAADKLAYFTDTSAGMAVTDITTFGRSVIDDSNAAAALTTLGIANHNNIVVSAAGEMTIPTQPAFEAYNSATDGSATGDGTTATVIFDTEVSDQGGDYDNATGTFTAPVSGFYHLMAQVRHGTVASGHTSGFMNIATSNETIRNYWDPYANSRKSDASSTLTMSAITYMDAADTATVSTNVSGGAKDVGIIGNRGQTTFSGVLLC